MPLPPCLHLSVTVFEHIGRLLSSVDEADAMPPGIPPLLSPVAGIGEALGAIVESVVEGLAGAIDESGVDGVDGGVEASGVPGAVID